jgi:hypothetical protein
MSRVVQANMVLGGQAAREPAHIVALDPPEPFDSFYRRELVGVIALARALCGPPARTWTEQE